MTDENIYDNIISFTYFNFIGGFIMEVTVKNPQFIRIYDQDGLKMYSPLSANRMTFKCCQNEIDYNLEMKALEEKTKQLAIKKYVLEEDLRVSENKTNTLIKENEQLKSWNTFLEESASFKENIELKCEIKTLKNGINNLLCKIDR